MKKLSPAILTLLLLTCAAVAECAATITLLSPANNETISTPLTVVLKWDSVSGASQYRVIAHTAGAKNAEIDEAGIKATECRTAVRPATKYYWLIVASDSKGRQIAVGKAQSFKTPIMPIQEILDANIQFEGVRPGAHIEWMQIVPQETDQQISPWYSKKVYDQSPPPSFEQIKDKLPQPIWDGHDDALEMYWYAWNTFFTTWVYAPKNTPHRNVSNMLGCPTWAGFGSTMIWDSAFMMQFARYADAAYPCITALDNCYARQHENGFICRESDNENDETYAAHPVNLPLLAWAEWSYYEVSGDANRLRRVFLPLVKQYEWHMLYFRRANGLFQGQPIGDGMDDSPRSETAYSYMSQTAVMAWTADLLGKMAKLSGRDDMASWFQKDHREISKLINDLCWDGKYSIYNDLTKDGKPITSTPEHGICKHGFVFWPLITGTATPGRADFMLSHMANQKTFLRPNGVGSLSADSNFYNSETGAYWRGSVWPPIQCIAINGARRYGAEGLAESIARRYFDAFLEAYKAKKDITEFIAPEKPVMRGYKKFVGWGGIAPISMLFEDIFGIRANAPSNKIDWYIRRLERHGVENLKFGNRTVSLICQSRKSASDGCKITVKSDGDFSLVLHTPFGVTKKLVRKGEIVLDIR